MKFINVFDFSKYFKRDGDGKRAKIGHINHVIEELGYTEFLSVSSGEKTIICYKLPKQINGKDAWSGNIEGQINGKDAWSGNIEGAILLVSWNSNNTTWEIKINGSVVLDVLYNEESVMPPLLDTWTAGKKGFQGEPVWVVSTVLIKQPLQSALETLAQTLGLLILSQNNQPDDPVYKSITTLQYTQSGIDAPLLSDSTNLNWKEATPNVQSSYVGIGEYLFTDIANGGYFNQTHIVTTNGVYFNQPDLTLGLTDGTYDWDFQVLVIDPNNFTLFAKKRLTGTVDEFLASNDWDLINPNLVITISQI